MNSASDELQRRLEITGPKIPKYLEQVESKIFKRTNKYDTHHHGDNHIHNVVFRKDYTAVIGRLPAVNPFLEDLFMKFRTDIADNEEVCAFCDAIPKIGQKQYKEFVDTRLIRCKKLVPEAITKKQPSQQQKQT